MVEAGFEPYLQDLVQVYDYYCFLLSSQNFTKELQVLNLGMDLTVLSVYPQAY